LRVGTAARRREICNRGVDLRDALIDRIDKDLLELVPRAVLEADFFAEISQNKIHYHGDSDIQDRAGKHNASKDRKENEKDLARECDCEEREDARDNRKAGSEPDDGGVCYPDVVHHVGDILVIRIPIVDSGLNITGRL